MLYFRRFIALIWFVSLVSGAAVLPPDEVESLRVIARRLGKGDWDFGVDPCSGLSGWANPNPVKGSENALTCNCSFDNSTTCHVTSIDLTRNYLNGTIPPEWGSMKLVNISLLGNRITGSIPKELANITTLQQLVLEYNQLSGTIPPELGNLPQIQRLRVSDNNFIGSIPNFVQNWTNMEKLVIQASGLAGPIPSGIASLTKMTDMRISDLNGNDSSLPSLSPLKKLKTLILRSCNIVGTLPEYIGDMTTLKVLDLSFNKLTGPIPESFIGLSNTDYIDLSYNNITYESLPAECQPRKLNLFASSKGNTNSAVSCLRSSCERKYYSLRINCGGKQEADDKGTSYDDDTNSGGASNFFSSRTNWGFSSTGHFLDDDRPRDSYTWQNASSISGQNQKLYTDARLSPLSLTYYGYCLMDGNYTVNLHFAEIMFTDERKYSSLGKRIFDVYIQGKLVLKDFNIELEAGGVNKPLTKNFTAVVADNTLDVRFYWAGKGTNGMPVRGVYGPLISAISVDPNFTPPSSSEGGSSISGGAIGGIVVGVLLATILVLGVLWWKGCFARKDSMHDDLKGLDLHTGSFTLRQIKAATNNFDPANKIGEGGFGPVFKGVLLDGTVIAVKQLSSKSKQGNREFINEIGMISALQHPHLVKLYGCCIESNQLLLVYEYLENNSLARALFGPEDLQLHLDWPMRHKICIGIARGLAYLHEESRLKIVHRDIKATNVLLDKNLMPKISDFGLAKLDEEDNTHISTRVAGTLSNTSMKTKDDCFYLLDWANTLKARGNLLELVDSRLGSDFNKEEAMTAINVGLQCTNALAAERPSMSTVVSMLEGTVGVQHFVSGTNVSVGKVRADEVTEGQSISMDVPWTGSSTNTVDLYPVTVDTEYWEKRDL
ncbi:hypothetical protein SASPL_144404 [Salvia splendens]|uniref:non-specific serine/threonine protein kinase n=1 Tax=Salvia splendens TaxID=180675 RepID=A0A8X8WFQ9_SALSN|nr:hypothetical protein SASPL_144404 [Salvia splendens]